MVGDKRPHTPQRRPDRALSGRGGGADRDANRGDLVYGFFLAGAAPEGPFVDETWRTMQRRLDWVYSRRIAFIVGATRWGSAMIERALDAHPEIAAKGEGRIADSLSPLMGQAVGHYRRRLAEARAEAELAGLPFSAALLDATDGMHLARIASTCSGVRSTRHLTALPSE